MTMHFAAAYPPHAGGTRTEYVFNTMKPKEILRFPGLLGTFFLREDSDNRSSLLPAVPALRRSRVLSGMPSARVLPVRCGCTGAHANCAEIMRALAGTMGQ